MQLIRFAVLSVPLRDAARIHGHAARRAGASREELHAVIDLAYLFGGVDRQPRAVQSGGCAELEAKAAAEEGAVG